MDRTRGCSEQVGWGVSTQVHTPDRISKETKTDTQTIFAQIWVGCGELSGTQVPQAENKQGPAAPRLRVSHAGQPVPC